MDNCVNNDVALSKSKKQEPWISRGFCMIKHVCGHDLCLGQLQEVSSQRGSLTEALNYPLIRALV